MTRPTFDDTPLQPLVTDADIQQRVARLVGRACTRQLWLMFLDDLGRQLPLLVPVDGLPVLPDDEQTAEVLDRVREVMQDLGAVSIIVVFERYASATLSVQDIEWARSLRDACEACGIVLRAELLSHRGGVRWIASEELDAAATAAC